MIRVESVKVVETNRNYKHLFHALFLLDLLVSDGKLHYTNDFKITDLDINIINNLFVTKNLSSLDEYIRMTFKSFVKNKKQITINMFSLSRIKNEELISLIIEDEVDAKKSNIDYENIDFRHNLISSKIFDIFPSTTNININMGDRDSYQYIFNLFMFLEIISKSDTWKMIKIKERAIFESQSWLYKYYKKCSSSLVSEYEKHGLSIKLEASKDQHEGGMNVYLMICRM